jgi:hypothetical protein
VTVYGDPVILHGRIVTGRDSYGDDIYTDVDVAAQSQAFDPGGSVESVQGQDLIVTQPTVYLEPGASVDGVSAVTVRGVRYDVDGTPAVWVSPFTGLQRGVVVRLKRVTG